MKNIKRIIASVLVCMLMATIIVVPVSANEASNILKDNVSEIITNIATRNTDGLAMLNDGVNNNPSKNAWKSITEAKIITDRDNLVLTFKLNGMYEITSLAVYERYLKVVGGMATGVDVEIGMSGSDFKKVVDNNALNSGDDGASVKTEFSFDAAKGDTIKLTFKVHNNSTAVAAANSGESQYQICEIEAYGTEVVGNAEQICLKKQVNINLTESNKQLPIAAITDGTYSGAQTLGSGIYDRYCSSSVTSPLIVEIDLSKVYKEINTVSVVTRYLSEVGLYADSVKVETGLTDKSGMVIWTEAGAGSLTSGGNGQYVVDNITLNEAQRADKLRITFARNDYTTSKKYEVAEIMAWGEYDSEIPKTADNVLKNQHIEVNLPAIASTITESKMIDGNTNSESRYASETGVIEPLTAVIRMDAEYTLYGFSIYERFDTNYVTCSDDTKIELGRYDENGGVIWTVVADDKSLTPRTTEVAGAVIKTEIPLDNECTNVSSIRISFNNKNAKKIQYQIAEIEAYGEKTDDTKHLSSLGFSSGDVCPNNGEFSITAGYENVNPGSVIIALYNNNDMIAVGVGNAANPIGFNVPSDKTIDKIRVFSWNDMSDLKPVLPVWEYRVYH